MALRSVYVCFRRKASAGRPASCTCTCETVMIPSASASAADVTSQLQQQGPSAVDDYYSDWTGNQREATSDETEDSRTNLISGHSLVNDVNTVDRQVPLPLSLTGHNPPGHNPLVQNPLSGGSEPGDYVRGFTSANPEI